MEFLPYEDGSGYEARFTHCGIISQVNKQSPVRSNDPAGVKWFNISNSMNRWKKYRSVLHLSSHGHYFYKRDEGVFQNNMEPDLKTKMIESDLIQREQVSDTDRL